MQPSSNLAKCILLSATLAALGGCGNGSGFAGSSGKASSPKPAPATAPLKTTEAQPTPTLQTLTAVATGSATLPTPQGSVDIDKTGFQCGPAMQTASGNWSGSYSGNAVGLLPVTGHVSYTFAYKDAQTMGMHNFQIYGGLFGGDEIKSIAIDFDLHCGDLQLQNAVVQHGGLTVDVALALTKQSWNPPSLSGTWKAQTQGISVAVASGTWTVSKD